MFVWFGRAASVINAIGMCTFFVMMLLILAEVVLRYFFGSTIPGTIETVQLLQVVGVGLCLAWTQRQKANIAVDLFVDKLPAAPRTAMAVLNNLVAMGIIAVMAYGVYKVSSTTGAMRETTDTLRLPLYPFRWLLAFGFALLALQLLVDTINALRGAPGRSNHEEVQP